MSVAAYLMASYGTFGVMGASLFGFGVGWPEAWPGLVAGEARQSHAAICLLRGRRSCA